jgi:N4-gp56 family major capsid protein
VALQTTATAGLSVAYQKVFSKKLLDYAKQKLVLKEYATRVPFPKNAGAKTIRFFRPDVGSRTNVQTLTEGVPINTFRETVWTPIDATLKQFGEASKVSDILSATELFGTLKQNIVSMGEDAALHADYQMVQELLDTTNSAGPIATANNRYAGGAASFNALVALTPSQGKMQIVDLLGAMTRLKITRAPKVNGDYVAVAPPQVTYDMMGDTKFVDAGIYGTTRGLFTGEIGKWYGVRIVETTAPWIEANTVDTIGTYDGAGSIYTTLVLGSGAFGVPEMAGQSQFDPKVIINDRPDKSDPLNQFVIAGWKSYWVTVVLNNLWAVALRSKTSYTA